MNTSLHQPNPSRSFDKLIPDAKDYSLDNIIANAGRPEKVIDIEIIDKVDKIIAIIDLEDHSRCGSTDVVIINHDDFHAWVENEGLLDYEVQGHMPDDGSYMRMGYAEYLKGHMSRCDVKKYIIDNNIRAHEWSI